MHLLKLKEIDVLFTSTIALSCYRERNRWQIITEASNHGLAEVQKLDQRTFQVADRQTGSGWQDPAARQSRVPFPPTDTNARPKRQIQKLKLCR